MTIKFEYHYSKNILFTHQGTSRQSITKTFTTNWNSPGFILEPASHWITFTHYPNRITAFYKETKEEADPSVVIPSLSWNDWKVSPENLAPLTQKITYYQKDLPKISPVTFTFTPQDEVEKIDGVWVKKLK